MAVRPVMAKGRREAIAKHAAPAVAVLGMLALWQAACSLQLVPSYLLPSPAEVCVALANDAELIGMHAATTLAEALIGLALGVALGFSIACLMERFRFIDAALTPLITLSQTIPTVAIAPLLVLWLGYDMLPKIVLVTLTTFFPIVVSVATGFKSVDADEIDLLRTMGASRFQAFRYAKLPAALPSFFSGLRMSATYAVVGAVVAEWLGGFSGLGVYMTRVRKSFAYDSMFASIVVIAVVSLLLLTLTRILERIAMPWERHEEDR